MVAGEEKPLLIQQRYAARRMTGHRNGREARGQFDRRRAVEDPFGVRNRLHIFTMNDSPRAELLGILGRIGHVVFMREKNITETAVPLEEVYKLLDIAR